MNSDRVLRETLEILNEDKQAAEKLAKLLTGDTKELMLGISKGLEIAIIRLQAANAAIDDIPF